MRLTDRQTAIHEAGHAVVGHLVGVAIDHVTIIPKGFVAGYSRPVRRPVATTADKLWGGICCHQPQAGVGQALRRLRW